MYIDWKQSIYEQLFTVCDRSKDKSTNFVTRFTKITMHILSSCVCLTPYITSQEIKKVKLQLLTVISFSLLLTACGGGGSGGPDNTNVSTANSAAPHPAAGSGGTGGSGGNSGTTQPEPTGNGSATLSWSIPTTRESGAGLSMGEIAGYRVFYGSNSNALNSVIDVTNPYTTSLNLTNLVASTVYYFQITAYDTNSIESERSNTVTRTAI